MLRPTKLAAISLLSLLLHRGAVAQNIGQTVVVQPTGEYAEIEVARGNSALKKLNSDIGGSRQAAINEILAAPETFNPVVLMRVGLILFRQGKVEDGQFWFRAGQVRALTDCLICADVSARGAYRSLCMQSGNEINQDLIAHWDTMQDVLKRAVDWDRKTPHNYDRRWVNLHGLNATGSAFGDNVTLPLSEPKNTWDDISEKARISFMSSLKASVESRLSRKQKARQLRPSPEKPSV
jgi:hypothetical protein